QGTPARGAGRGAPGGPGANLQLRRAQGMRNHRGGHTVTTLENTDVSSSDPPPPAVETDDRLRVREAQFRNVSVEVSVWIGKTRLSFGELSHLRPGHGIEMDHARGAP